MKKVKLPVNPKTFYKLVSKTGLSKAYEIIVLFCSLGGLIFSIILNHYQKKIQKWLMSESMKISEFIQIVHHIKNVGIWIIVLNAITGVFFVILWISVFCGDPSALELISHNPCITSTFINFISIYIGFYIKKITGQILTECAKKKKYYTYELPDYDDLSPDTNIEDDANYYDDDL